MCHTLYRQFGMQVTKKSSPPSCICGFTYNLRVMFLMIGTTKRLSVFFENASQNCYFNVKTLISHFTQNKFHPKIPSNEHRFPE